MTHFTVSELKSLPVGSEPAQVPRAIARRLHAIGQRAKARLRVPQPVLTLGQNLLTAGQVVGVIATNGATLEILPKIDGANGDVRRALVHMLSIAGHLRVADGAVTRLASQRRDLLEIVIRLFADRLLAAVRRGLPFRYVTHEEDLPRLRGRLDTRRQFTRLAIRPDRLACRFDGLSVNTPLNRLLKAAIDIARDHATSPGSIRSLVELSARFESVDTSRNPCRSR